MTRLARALAGIAMVLPHALDKLYLQYARAHLTKHNPQHPALPEIVLRIRELEGM